MKPWNEFLIKMQNKDHMLRVEEVLLWVEETFPQLVCKIAWNQPMFSDHDTFIIGFSVASKHLAISPEAYTMNIFSNEIKNSGYAQGSNLFKIPWNEAVDYNLLQRMIQYNIDDKKNCTTFWRKAQ